MTRPARPAVAEPDRRPPAAAPGGRIDVPSATEAAPPLAADHDALRGLLATTLDALAAGRERRGGPTPAGAPDGPRRALDARLDAGPAEASGALPEQGQGGERALAELVELLAAGHTDPADPACAAHLHCPPLAVAVAADLAAAVLNPSLDSWDQGPSSAAAEDRVIAALAELAGFDPARAGGTMTTGGTASTLTALLLAREAAAGPIRIACSTLAHFSVGRAAQVLGLADDAVRPLPIDDDGRMSVPALEALLADDADQDWVVVATAGTTDLGAIDPLPAIADVVARHGAWLHVDAAYGGGTLFSPRLAPLLAGVERADSVSLDLHKLGWQPVAAGMLLLRDRARMAPIDLQVAYLNTVDDDEAGYEDRLGRSLRTTRRPDAFKLLVTMRALGREGIAALVERCHALAAVAAEAVAAEPALELHGPPTLTTVLFRPVEADPLARDERCARIRRRLLREGRAVIGRTEVPGEGPGQRRLKLTLLNPAATDGDVRALVRLVAEAAAAEA